MVPVSICSLYLLALVAFSSSSAIPASNPQTPALIPSLSVGQATKGLTKPLFQSTWSLPDAAPNASFVEIEQEFRQVIGFAPPRCDAAAYGRNLQVESCREAQKMIPLDRRPLRFGMRHSGRWNVNLPYRWSSCWLSRSQPPRCFAFR